LFLVLVLRLSPRLPLSRSGENSVASKRNFLLVWADDARYPDLGCYGGEIDTPASSITCDPGSEIRIGGASGQSVSGGSLKQARSFDRRLQVEVSRTGE